jgi:hypothetical protein
MALADPAGVVASGAGRHVIAPSSSAVTHQTINGAGFLNVGIFERKPEIDVAPLIEPFMRAKFLARWINRVPVSVDGFTRACPASPNVLSRFDIKTHCIENCGAVLRA